VGGGDHGKVVFLQLQKLFDSFFPLGRVFGYTGRSFLNSISNLTYLVSVGSFIPTITRMKYVVVSGGIYSESISEEQAVTDSCITGVISGIGKGVIGTPLYESN
jgi:hypothetical protein